MSQVAAPTDEPSVTTEEVTEAVDAFLTSLVQVGALRYNASSRTYVLACEMSEVFFRNLVEQAKYGLTFR